MRRKLIGNFPVDTVNTFIDTDGNYCLLYDDYHTLASARAKDQLNMYEILFTDLGERFSIEYFPFDTPQRDPPRLKYSCHRDGCIIIRIPYREPERKTKKRRVTIDPLLSKSA
jgi:hypothetical protein